MENVKSNINKTRKTFCFWFFYAIAKIIYPKREIRYETEPAEGESAVYVCNHSGALGPAVMTCYFDRPFKPWVISNLFDKKTVSNYVYHDFFFGRGKKHKKFYRALSKFVAKILPSLVVQIRPVLVYHDSINIIRTFKDSAAALNSGDNLVIFPECPTKFSEYVSELHDGFVDVARYYFKATGKKLKFYPVYIPADLKVVSVGEPIVYDNEVPAAEERKLVAKFLKSNIDRLARALPTKKTIPFMQEDFYKYYPEFVEDTSAYWKFCAKEKSE